MWHRVESNSQTPALSFFELRRELPSPHSYSKATPLVRLGCFFVIALSPSLAYCAEVKRLCSQGDSASLFFSSFSCFAFDLLHPLHISGPRCTGRILGVSTRRARIHTGRALVPHSSKLTLGWAGNIHQMCYYVWEGDTRLVCPGFRLEMAIRRWRYEHNDDSDGLFLHGSLLSCSSLFFLLTNSRLPRPDSELLPFRLEVCGLTRAGHEPIAAATSTD